ncbi:hypothetical protein PQE71_gp067 [Bacillus phage Izhevsk]|uniref:Uncharacterized protein n=1 Tax=Bacillus phage Izhevsk TaxID=2724322 RepID=A0A6H0X615_9CAUD|nr:hypothetical protein PQE71_gp067 [Bacillus phage Izhevsk]QIW89749.1 hypothetical protein Izhevsk_68 [Bacillus phage Izhevsk]
MIDTVAKLKVHLKLFKSQALKAGATQFQLYPMFCTYYDKNKDKYGVDKFQVLDLACEILIEED